MSQGPLVLVVPGLRGHVADHWQVKLAERLPGARSLEPLGREHLDCAERVAQIEHAVLTAQGPVLLVAHSGGCLSVAHWARGTRLAGRITGALLATPADFERPLPAEYPTRAQLEAGGWLPVPRQPLGFRSLVAASRNDPLAAFGRVAELAQAWGSELVDVGPVGHLNPASGFGDWPGADALLVRLAARGAGD